MKQLTLLSLYGHGGGRWHNLSAAAWRSSHSHHSAEFFKPYHPLQIHGTLVGMEKLIGYSDDFNVNIWVDSGINTHMDFSLLVDTLKQHLPMTVRFGGFPQFLSEFKRDLGLSPYERSFQVQWPTNRFTLIGWPHRRGDFTADRLLEKFREDMKNNCHIQHKFKNDNDLFLVVGEIVGLKNLSDIELAQIKGATPSLESDVRNYLVARKVDLKITADEVCIAQYEKETLDLHSTIPHRVNDGMSANFISGLYDQSCGTVRTDRPGECSHGLDGLAGQPFQRALELLQDAEFVVPAVDLGFAVNLFEDLLLPGRSDHAFDGDRLGEVLTVAVQMAPDDGKGLDDGLKPIVAAKLQALEQSRQHAPVVAPNFRCMRVCRSRRNRGLLARNSATRFRKVSSLTLGKITSRTMPSGCSTTASATWDRICILPSTRSRSWSHSR